MPATARRARVRRPLRIAGLAALAALLAYALIGLPFFVFPAQDPLPAHADVAEVLGYPKPQRIALADRLLTTGVVGHILISEPNGPLDAGWRRRCAAPETTCFLADPFTTQGEARQLGREAARHRWTSAIVITQTAHLDRARLIVGRCFRGRLTMRASGEPPQGGWVWQYLYQTVGTVKALLVTTTC